MNNLEKLDPFDRALERATKCVREAIEEMQAMLDQLRETNDDE